MIYFCIAKEAGEELVAKYEAKMRERYSDLFTFSVEKLDEKLTGTEEMTKFISDMENRFSTIMINTTSCATILKSVSKGMKWNFLKCHDLFNILERYVKDETNTVCEGYEDLRNGYREVKFISAKLPYTKRIREVYTDEFMARISPYVITPATRDFIKGLWEEFRWRFNLPTLDVMLYDETYKSLQLTWLIRTDQETSMLIKALLIQRMPLNRDFLQEKDVTHIFFNHERLYPVSCHTCIRTCIYSQR